MPLAKPRTEKSLAVLFSLSLVGFALTLAPAARAEAPSVGPDLPRICHGFSPVGDRSFEEELRYDFAMGIAWMGSDWPGWERVRFWRESGNIRVVVHSRVTGTPFFGRGDYEHCRQEVWRELPDGGLTLLRAEVSERKKGGAHRIEIVAEGSGYRYSFQAEGADRKSRFVEGPATIESMTTDALYTSRPARVMRIFGYGVYENVEVQTPVEETFNGRRYVRHQMKGELRRVAWFDSSEIPRLARLCAAEILGAIIDGWVTDVSTSPLRGPKEDKPEAPAAPAGGPTCGELDYD